jgi:hypothetical protein
MSFGKVDNFKYLGLQITITTCEKKINIKPKFILCLYKQAMKIETTLKKIKSYFIHHSYLGPVITF